MFIKYPFLVPKLKSFALLSMLDNTRTTGPQYTLCTRLLNFKNNSSFLEPKFISKYT
jgi:hypothetical protein